jgi:hypothetical protein
MGQRHSCRLLGASRLLLQQLFTPVSRHADDVLHVDSMVVADMNLCGAGCGSAINVL